MTAEHLWSAELLQSGGLRALLWGPEVTADVLAWAGLDDRPRRAADLGSGRGFLAMRLATALPRTRVDGFELDPQLLRDGRDRVRRAGLRGRVALHEGDAESLDVDDGRYDLVAMQAVLVHQSRPERLLREARRILRPGGLLLAVEPDPAQDFRTFDPTPEGVADPWSRLVRGAREAGAGTWEPREMADAVREVFGAVAVRAQGGHYRTAPGLTARLAARDDDAEEAHLELLGSLFERGGGSAEDWAAYTAGLALGRRRRAASIRAGTWSIDAPGSLHLYRAARV